MGFGVGTFISHTIFLVFWTRHIASDTFTASSRGRGGAPSGAPPPRARIAVKVSSVFVTWALLARRRHILLFFNHVRCSFLAFPFYHCGLGCVLFFLIHPLPSFPSSPSRLPLPRLPLPRLSHPLLPTLIVTPPVIPPILSSSHTPSSSPCTLSLCIPYLSRWGLEQLTVVSWIQCCNHWAVELWYQLNRGISHQPRKQI